MNSNLTTENPAGFSNLGLAAPLLRALADKKYAEPSPIQERAIPLLLEGRDIWGCAQTGTGKTAAFALPILQNLSRKGGRSHPRRPRALVLTPTRELACQIADNFAAYGKYLDLRHTVVFGGVGLQGQIRTLARGIDILVATPGRLLDLIDRRAVELSAVEIFVLDEADRMLDMGFAPDVREIEHLLPEKRQSLLFSATMPEEIRRMAESLLDNPARVEVAPAATTAERVEQRICHVENEAKPLLLTHLLGEQPSGLVLVFTRTKHGADKVASRLEREGVRTEVLHGNKSQSARQRALDDFRTGRSRVMVATDIAARGIDVKGITLVINYDVPVEPESYVHRIGRTARAGAEGLALTLCNPGERNLVRQIQKLIRQQIPAHPHPFALEVPAEARSQGPARRHGPGHAGKHRPHGHAQAGSSHPKARRSRFSRQRG